MKGRDPPLQVGSRLAAGPLQSKGLGRLMTMESILRRRVSVTIKRLDFKYLDYRLTNAGFDR
jgi:hypothetical protein